MAKTKFRMFTDGHATYAELGGKTIGKGVVSVGFSHTPMAGEKPNLILELDLDDFEFMPDGYFDEAQKAFNEAKDAE